MKKQYTAPSVTLIPCRTCGMLALSIKDDETITDESQVLSSEKDSPWDDNPFNGSPWDEVK